jgi:hypothetical protein
MYYRTLYPDSNISSCVGAKFFLIIPSIISDGSLPDQKSTPGSENAISPSNKEKL